MLMWHLSFYDYGYGQTFDVCAPETFKSAAENEWYQTPSTNAYIFQVIMPKQIIPHRLTY